MSNNTQPTFVVRSTEVLTKTGKSGPYYTQAVIFERGDGAAYPLDVFVDNGKAHAPGAYAVSLKSFTPSRFGIDFKPVLGQLIAPAKA